MQMDTTHRLLDELEDALEMPLVTIASGWRGDCAVDVGRDGVRAFIQVLEALAEEQGGELDHIGLFLAGEGGYPAFADGVWRVLRGRGITFTAVVPYLVSGVYSILALAAEDVLVHPHGGLGAYDRGPVRQITGRLDAETIEHLGDLPPEFRQRRSLVDALATERHWERLSHRLVERIFEGADSGVGARVTRSLRREQLGSDLALSGAELGQLGLTERPTDADVMALVWELYCAYEDLLELREKPGPRYTESDVSGEVEFEMASGQPGALVETAQTGLVFELDTGKPDPDTGMLDGVWLWE